MFFMTVSRHKRLLQSYKDIANSKIAEITRRSNEHRDELSKMRPLFDAMTYRQREAAIARFNGEYIYDVEYNGTIHKVCVPIEGERPDRRAKIAFGKTFGLTKRVSLESKAKRWEV